MREWASDLENEWFIERVIESGSDWVSEWWCERVTLAIAQSVRWLARSKEPRFDSQHEHSSVEVKRHAHSSAHWGRRIRHSTLQDRPALDACILFMDELSRNPTVKWRWVILVIVCSFISWMENPVPEKYKAVFTAERILEDININTLTLRITKNYKKKTFILSTYRC